MARKKKEELKDETIVDTDAMKKELMAYVDSQLDERLEKVVSDSLRKNVIEEIDKANKKVIRMKNRKIFIKNIFLILFFLIICFLVYLLYSNHYFDRYFSKTNDSKTVDAVQEENVTKEEEEVVLPTLDELKEKYSSYLDLYVLSEKSIYLEDFYQGNLTKELKSYYSLNQIDFDTLDVEDDYNLIQDSMIRNTCMSLFDDGCDFVNFDYNGNKVRYFKRMNSFITNSILEKEDTLIHREIIDIQEDSKMVSITTIEGIVVGEQLYSIVPNEYISDYYGEGFLDYADQLNKVIYTFNNKKLVKVERG